jgi:hypothetical protein
MMIFGYYLMAVLGFLLGFSVFALWFKNCAESGKTIAEKYKIITVRASAYFL